MRWTLLATLALLAGCADDAADLQREVEPGAASTADAHGTPSIDESATTAQLQGAGWVATRTVTLRNGIGAAQAADTGITNGVGLVAIAPGTALGYEIVVVLAARGATEEQAREQVEAARVVHEDALDGDTLRVRTRVEPPPPPPALLGIVQMDLGFSSTVTAALPESVDHVLRASTGAGDVTVERLAGTLLDVDTGSGAIDIADTAFGITRLDAGSGNVHVRDAQGLDLDINTGSGNHDVEATFDNVELDTGAGSQRAVLGAGATGVWDFRSGGGSIAVEARRSSEQAFDIAARTGNGDVDVRLSDGEDVGRQEENAVRVRSTGFDGAPVQTVIQLAAGSGNVAFADARATS